MPDSGDWLPKPGEIVWDAAWGGTHETNERKKPGVKEHEIVQGVPRPQAEVLTYNEDEDKLWMRWLPGGPDVERTLDEVALVPDEYVRHRAVPQPMSALEEAPGPDEFEPKWIQVIRCIGPEGSVQVKLGPIPEGHERKPTQEQIKEARRFYKGAFDAEPTRSAGAVLPYMAQEDGEEGLHH